MESDLLDPLTPGLKFHDFVLVKTLPHGEGLPQPRYETVGSSGVDLYSANDKEIRLLPNTSCMILTGIAIEMPDNLEGQVRSRSGLAYKYNVVVLNSPGTIDSDYRGEIKVVLFNHGRGTFLVKRGMRIAQLVFCPVARVSLYKSADLTDTERGVNGHGSTGMSYDEHLDISRGEFSND